MHIRALAPPDSTAFQALRLRGLRECPEAFASSYEEEVDTPLSEIERRLQPKTDSAIFGGFQGAELCAHRLGIVILRLMGFGVLKLLFGMMFRILFGVKQADERQFERIAITVPECPECNRGPLFPIAASMSDSALKVAAHRTFVDALRCLNEQ